MKPAYILLVCGLVVPIQANARWPFASNGTVVVQANGVTVTDINNDGLEFKREYKVVINAQVTLTIEAHTSAYHKRYYFATLTQQDHRSIYFDPQDGVADKIIDPTLVSIVQEKCFQLMDMDKTFIAGNPSEFRDKDGNIWRRVPAS